MTGPAVARCPVPDRESAAAAAKTLLDERIIACANIVPGMLSLDEWQGKRGEAGESGMLVRTNALVMAWAMARLEELHPHTPPAVLGWHRDAARPGTTGCLGALPGSLDT